LDLENQNAGPFSQMKGYLFSRLSALVWAG
jgi:hypothetical protein